MADPRTTRMDVPLDTVRYAPLIGERPDFVVLQLHLDRP